MQDDFRAFREGRSQCYTAELFGVPHLYQQQFLRTGHDKPLKNKGRRTMFTPQQDFKLCRIVKMSTQGFTLGYNNDPIYPGILQSNVFR